MSDPTDTQQNRPLRRLRVFDLIRALGGATGAQILFLSVPLVLGSVLAITYVDTAAGTNIELSLAAVTLLTEGMIGNPYGFPTGPTAHVSPLPVLWVAGVYRSFGVYTPTARMVLSGFNTFCHVAACALAIGICRRTCRTGAAIWFVVIVICLVPVTLYGDVVLYRAYEQAFAAMILMLGGYLFVCYRDRPNRASHLAIGLGTLSGIAGLTSPATFPPLIVFAMAHAWVAQAWHVRLIRAASSFAVIALFLLPWAIRNQIELGAFIPFRSNFALELRTGNEDGATGMTPVTPNVHPFQSAENTQRMAAIGEVAYMRSLGRTALQWVQTHPWGFIKLCLRRVWLSLIPAPAITGWAPVLGEEWYIVRDIIGALEICSFLLILLARRDPLFWFSLSILPLAPYFLTYTNTRYTSIAYFPSLCVIAVGLDIVLFWYTRTIPDMRGSNLGADPKDRPSGNGDDTRRLELP
jgi:hypothetical protein